MRLTGQPVRVSITFSASIMHMSAARRFAERAEFLDDPSRYPGLTDEQKQPATAELMDAALAAVLTANAAIEARINEFFLEYSLFPDGGVWFSGFSKDIGRALRDAWKGAERYDLVTKCHIASAIFGKARLDFGGGSAQHMALLVYLRNELIHHKPIMVEHGRRAHESDDTMERKLHDRFAHSRIAPAAVSFRWNGCLGAGCARWAVATAESFQDDFFRSLGVDFNRA
jgi:hypothetical protein